MTRSAWPAVLLGLVALLAYANSFSGAFLFDDQHHIAEDLRIHHLWPISPLLFGTQRPLVDVSLALNYAAGGLNPWGYHLVNFLIHWLAGVTLFGVLRRTFRTDRLQARYGQEATGLALAIALLWLVHPLQTQSVTYIIQRGESLMGLCYLLTLYAVIRSTTAPHPRRWSSVALAACALGMASKPVMVTAPVLVAVYDRIFLASSWRMVWHRHRWLLVGLAGTWGLLAWLLIQSHTVVSGSAGLTLANSSPATYAMTQPGVLLHYLRLAVWPQPLVLDYHWPLATSFESILPSLVVIIVLCLTTGWALRRHPAAGFLGVWLFGILLPSSSVIPLSDPAFEYRMYLPLAAPITAVVLISSHGLSRWLDADHRRWIAVASVISTALLLASLTIHRNADYQSEQLMWEDTIAKRPKNPRAHVNLGHLLFQDGRLADAVVQLRQALKLDPADPDVHYNLGAVLSRQGHTSEAVAHYLESIRLNPSYVQAHYNLGNILLEQGRFTEAVAQYEEVLREDPTFVRAYDNLGNALVRQGDVAAAIARYREAIRLQPEMAEAHYGVAAALVRQGRDDLAAAEYAQAIQLNPRLAPARAELGALFARQNRVADAMAQYQAAIQLQPENADTHYNVGTTLLRQGQVAQAVEQLSLAIRLDPQLAQAHYNLAGALMQQERWSEAAVHYQQALQLRPNDADAHSNFGLVLFRLGLLPESVAHLSEAAQLRPDDDAIRKNLATAVAAYEQTR